MRRALVLVAIALAVLPASAGGQSEDIAGLIQDQLNTRAQAILSRDRTTFLGTNDPGQVDFGAFSSSYFDRMEELPLQDYSLTLDLETSPELTRERDRGRYGLPVVVAVVEERAKIADFDDRPELGIQYLTFVNRGDLWRVASDTDASDLGLNSVRRLWHFGPVKTVRSDNFMVVFHQEDRAASEEVLLVAEEALIHIDRIWSGDWNRKTVIYLPNGEDELKALLDAEIDVSNFVAFATSDVDRGNGWSIGASRIVINPVQFSRHTLPGKRAVLAHELAHVATRTATGPFVNLMVEEGFAQLAEPPGRAGTTLLSQRVRRGYVAGLPGDLEFFSNEPDDVSLAYQRAFSAFGFLRDRYGLDKVVEFYTLLGSKRLEPGTSDYHLDQALRATFETGRDELERSWAETLP